MTQHSRVRYGDAVIHFRIDRAVRASPRIRVHVEPDGQVIVQALGDISDSAVGEAVRRRARWIHTHLQAINERKSQLSHRDWVSGETFIMKIPNWGVGSDHRPIVATFTAEDH